MKRTMLLLAGALQGFMLFAQTTLPATTEPPTPIEPKANNLLEAFEHGHFHGSFRSFFMATDNARQLSDYHALAAGGTLHFASSPWHGFSFGLGGIFNYNLTSSDLSAKDSITGAVNRYEIGLFDVEDPKNRKNLDRIEELWLRYQWKKSRITVGQQSLQTPFVNYQDGRMRPTAEAGAWAEINDVKNIKMEGGYIWSISPRSTVEWFSVGESIGLYPKGLNPDGTGSGYPENLESMGIGMLGITRQWGKRTKVQVWDQYVENIFNTVFVQADYTHPLKNEHKLLFGLQMTHQDALSDGGNAEVSKTYFQKNGQSNVISAQTGWQHGPWQALAAYTRITAEGRFLSPREWGREPFYTFMARERVEGSGDSHSLTGRLNWQSKNKKIAF
ncbi:MAG: outer membrane porin, OprD family [Lewinellaceae bacterium]|nr:outer membrane porin, OprD family [Lewinellaceae bacterium]